MKDEMISVIIPNYNHALYLVDRLESVFNQTYTNYEVIILDDCSTDNSREIIEKYRYHPKVAHIVFNEGNSGSPFKQWKRGFELAKSDWIWIAESDDYCENSFLSKVSCNLDDDVAFIYCNSEIVDKNGKIFNNNRNWLNDLSTDHWNSDFIVSGISEIEQYLVYKNTVSNASSAVFNKKALEKINYDITDFKTCGDWLFFFQLALYGKIVYINESLNYWRQHNATTRVFKSIETEYVRVKEIKLTIDIFRNILNPYKFKIDSDRYLWINNWWLSRFSYRSLLNYKYILPPIIKENKLVFYNSLFNRLIKEFIKSIKHKTA